MRAQLQGEVDATAVRLVRWPSDADGRDEAARAGVPCLLVVGRGSPIPAVFDHEDWILDTADERDVAARLHNLATRGGWGPADVTADPLPVVPGGLGGLEARVARVLLSRPGRIVPSTDLTSPDDGAALDATSIRRLRRALHRSGWTLHVLGDRGLLVERDPS